MDFYTSDNVRLEYDDQGSGQAVIMLCGMGGNRVIWHDQVTALLAAGYRVVNIDCRNQGASEHTTKGLRIFRHAMDLREIVESLEIKQPILLGNSMGAATMFAYASLFGTKDVAALIDVDQSPKMIGDISWPYNYMGHLTWENFHESFTHPAQSPTYGKLGDETYRLNKEARQKYPYDAQLNLPFVKDHAFQDWRDVISELTCPFLVVVGEQSPYFDHRFAPGVAALAPHGDYRIIPECGHIVMAEQPAAFNEVLFEFLRTNEL